MNKLSILNLFTMLLIGLQLTGIINISWLIILLPTLVWSLILLVVFLVFLLLLATGKASLNQIMKDDKYNE